MDLCHMPTEADIERAGEILRETFEKVMKEQPVRNNEQAMGSPPKPQGTGTARAISYDS